VNTYCIELSTSLDECATFQLNPDSFLLLSYWLFFNDKFALNLDMCLGSQLSSNVMFIWTWMKEKMEPIDFQFG
jgi:hypothetical protein